MKSLGVVETRAFADLMGTITEPILNENLVVETPIFALLVDS